MLRMWRAGEEEEAWQASLRDMRTKKVQYFRSITSLMRYLRQFTHPTKNERDK